MQGGRREAELSLEEWRGEGRERGGRRFGWGFGGRYMDGVEKRIAVILLGERSRSTGRCDGAI